MDLVELKKEQLRLAQKIVLENGFFELKTIGGMVVQQVGDKILAVVVVCEFSSMVLRETKYFVLPNPLPFYRDYEAYRVLPAMVEAFNLLDEEPDLLLVEGDGINHPRRLGVASHVGLSLNIPTIGITDTLGYGSVEGEKILHDGVVCGVVLQTRQFAKPIYATAGYRCLVEAISGIVSQTLRYPHKMPEPLHLAHALARKMKKENFKEK